MARKRGRLCLMDLYVFGAGASAAEGAPATRDLFPMAYRALGPRFDPQVQEVWEFLEAVFQRPVTGPEAFRYLPPLDEVITLIDWSLHADQGLGPEYDPPRLYRIRQALEHLVCSVLEAALDRRRPQGGPHGRFARAVAVRSPESYALVSLNYDTLLDDALRAAGLVPDYGLEDGPGRGPLLLKLHGSLNWAHCPACDAIAVLREPVAHLLARSDGLACSRCGSRRLSGVVISPTWLKRYSPGRLTRVFERALEAVRRAHRIVFIGYSLPPADVAVHHLLRRGLLTRAHPGPPSVQVITRGPSEAVLDRFRRLFGPDVAFDGSGFRGQT